VNAVVLAVVVFLELAWSSRAAASDLTPEAVRWTQPPLMVLSLPSSVASEIS
jgi:hypothetical protein